MVFYRDQDNLAPSTENARQVPKLGTAALGLVRTQSRSTLERGHRKQWNYSVKSGPDEYSLDGLKHIDLRIVPPESQTGDPLPPLPQPGLFRGWSRSHEGNPIAATRFGSHFDPNQPTRSQPGPAYPLLSPLDPTVSSNSTFHSNNENGKNGKLSQLLDDEISRLARAMEQSDREGDLSEGHATSLKPPHGTEIPSVSSGGAISTGQHPHMDNFVQPRAGLAADPQLSPVEELEEGFFSNDEDAEYARSHLEGPEHPWLARTKRKRLRRPAVTMDGWMPPTLPALKARKPMPVDPPFASGIEQWLKDTTVQRPAFLKIGASKYRLGTHTAVFTLNPGTVTV